MTLPLRGDAAEERTPAPEARLAHVAAVVIGRNEAANLRTCLDSVAGRVGWTVYVDSGSRDGSPQLACEAGVDVVELDPTLPFSVARARNEGLSCVTRRAPQVELVQFVDGDSEMAPPWLERAAAALAQRPRVAVVFGGLRERFPRRSLYERLYQLDWDPRIDEGESCGGMAMMRVSALREVGPFHPDLCGFEDHELCFRLRQAGWQIQRLDGEMAIHEAGPLRFSDWWRRGVRTGHARAHEAALHRGSEARFSVRECRSIWFWGLLLPSLALAAWPASGGLSALLLAAYPAFGWRIQRRMRRRGVARADAALYAASCVAVKFPAALGQLRFHFERLWRSAAGRGRRG